MKFKIKNLKLKIPTKQAGLTILETLIYVVILTIVFFMIFKSVTSILVAHRSVKLSQTLESSGAVAMERILREIRNADSIDIAQSSFNVPLGVLKLAGVNEGVAYTTTFDLSGGIIRITKDAGTPSPLTSSDISVTSLIFRKVSNSISDGVKVEMMSQGSTGAETKSLDLYGFAVLRGSY